MKKFIYLSLCAVVSMLSACTYDEDIEEIRQEIEEIKATQKALQDAYNAGKLITDVSPKGELNDWLITFSDNTSITINSGRDGENGVNGINGTDGVTPYLKIDENKCWTVSYDNGETFVPLLDKNSNPIVAVGKDGEQGPQGPQGAQGPQGPQGEAGRDGYSVRVVTNDQGYYAFEVYNPTTNEVVDKVETQYSSNPKNIIKSIVEDTKDNVIITMESGEVYVFKKGDISNPMKLLSFKFLAENNPRNLLKDVNFEISLFTTFKSF